MERRNLDFGIDMTEEQWAELGRVADTLGADQGGFRWDEDEFEDIHVYLAGETAPALWRDYIADPGTYGARTRQVAEFHFNGGRPYARIEPPELADEPVLTDQEERAMGTELERWVRTRWHDLLRDSGIHFDRGHIPQG